ncbi:hypothetical protein BT69DRAFT_520801 [Atractiella rhizophila]|nr:hypothetical protein BT69DRAFT_520801 [Atractiella rhizophila]
MLVEDRQGLAHCIYSIGHIQCARGQNGEARKRFEEAKQLYLLVEDQCGLANCIRSIREMEQCRWRNEEDTRPSNEELSSSRSESIQDEQLGIGLSGSEETRYTAEWTPPADQSESNPQYRDSRSSLTPPPMSTKRSIQDMQFGSDCGALTEDCEQKVVGYSGGEWLQYPL